ncbi:hypothetical protein [Ilumatobacter sp.]|uniref:hypothetical protein n=1 Tax=Ilumatobacter sp. TaxID=1967498 RepID=UPI003B52FFD5
MTVIGCPFPSLDRKRATETTRYADLRDQPAPRSWGRDRGVAVVGMWEPASGESGSDARSHVEVSTRRSRRDDPDVARPDLAGTCGSSVRGVRRRGFVDVDR